MYVTALFTRTDAWEVVMNKRLYPKPHLDIQMNSEFKNEKWLTTRDVADLLSVTVAAIRNRVYRGQLKAFQPFGHGKGFKIYFRQNEILKLMNQSPKDF